MILLSVISQRWKILAKDCRLKMTQQTHEHDNDADGEDDVVGDVFLVWSICSHEVRRGDRD